MGPRSGITNEVIELRRERLELVNERTRRGVKHRMARPIANRPAGRPPVAAIVCHDCGEQIKREASCLSCSCGVGFSAQWDVSLGAGVYLGRIIRPEEVAA